MIYKNLTRNAFLSVGIALLSLPAMAADLTAEDLGLQCKKGKRLFGQPDSPYTPLSVDIITDYQNLNAGPLGGKQYKAVLKYDTTDKDGNALVDVIPLMLETRGNSRGSYCEFKPLRLIFLDQSVEASIEARVGNAVPPGDPRDYLTSYYNQLVDTPITEELKYAKQQDNIFSKLGDDVKLVTHCGRSQWKDIGGDTLQEQMRRLNEEFVLYQILSTLKTTTLNTRYADITYRDPGGNKFFTDSGSRFAFFREPPGEVKDRCKIDELEQAGANPNTEASGVQAEVLLKFVVQNDYSLGGHNVALLQSQNGNTYYVPYDFDLSAISNPNYFKNQGRSLREYAVDFGNYLMLQEHHGGVRGVTAVRVASTIWKKRHKILELINTSPLTDDRKRHFIAQWLNPNMYVTRIFLAATNPAVLAE